MLKNIFQIKRDIKVLQSVKIDHLHRASINICLKMESKGNAFAGITTHGGKKLAKFKSIFDTRGRMIMSIQDFTGILKILFIIYDIEVQIAN